MINISGFGLKATVVALQTFPMGFTLSQFADTSNPIEFEPMAPVGYEMLFDGDLFAFDKAAPVIVSCSVLPQTDDDINLKMMLTSKKGGVRWLPFSDVTTMVVTYPDGGRVVLSNGTIVSGPIGDTVLQTGRKACNTYKFAFGTVAGLQSSAESVVTVAQNILSII